MKYEIIIDCEVVDYAFTLKEAYSRSSEHIEKRKTLGFPTPTEVKFIPVEIIDE